MPHILTDLDAAAFDENTVNAAPQLLDADVTVTDSVNGWTGGALTVTGLLAEDTVGVQTGAQIYLDGASVMYDADGAGAGAAVSIGTASGGAGGTFTVTFNAAATRAGIEALIENLTYANVSDTPTASRDLVINVTDAAGEETPAPPAFAERFGIANPLDGVDVGALANPTFVDLDADGDLDLIVGEQNGFLRYFENIGTSSTPTFVEFIGAANPLDGLQVLYRSNATLADLDNDGDLDVLVGENNGGTNYFENTGTPAAAEFSQIFGAGNPLNGVDVGYFSNPVLVDIDGDGDLDVFIGNYDGTIEFFENTGTTNAPTFVPRPGASNPFDGVDVGFAAAPTFADLDGDGDLDVLVGDGYGALTLLENTGTVATPVFTPFTGSNLFDGIDVGWDSRPAFVDLDGDGDMDVLVGESYGTLRFFENTTGTGQTISVTVTAQNDAPEASGLPTDVTVTEDTAATSTFRR